MSETPNRYSVLCMSCGHLLSPASLCVGAETAAQIQAIHTNVTAHRVVLVVEK